MVSRFTTPRLEKALPMIDSCPRSLLLLHRVVVVVVVVVVSFGRRTNRLAVCSATSSNPKNERLRWPFVPLGFSAPWTVSQQDCEHICIGIMFDNMEKILMYVTENEVFHPYIIWDMHSITNASCPTDSFWRLCTINLFVIGITMDKNSSLKQEIFWQSRWQDFPLLSVLWDEKRPDFCFAWAHFSEKIETRWRPQDYHR